MSRELRTGGEVCLQFQFINFCKHRGGFLLPVWTGYAFSFSRISKCYHIEKRFIQHYQGPHTQQQPLNVSDFLPLPIKTFLQQICLGFLKGQSDHSLAIPEILRVRLTFILCLLCAVVLTHVTAVNPHKNPWGWYWLFPFANEETEGQRRPEITAREGMELRICYNQSLRSELDSAVISAHVWLLLFWMSG